jgi:hypothetical protein
LDQFLILIFENILMNKVLFITTVVLLYFSSCKQIAIEEPYGNNYYFESTQPIKATELSKIPNQFLGLYMNSDSTYLDIRQNIILSESFTTINVSKKEIDSLKKDFEIEKGRLISKKTKEIYTYRELKDSIEVTTKEIDIFFIFSTSQKAKKSKRHLILNEKDSIFWKVKFISLEKNKLTLTQIYSESDLKKMDSIMENKATMIDSSSFIIKPSRKEFKRLLELKNFGDQQIFKRTSK